jgi:hypothetical protein
VKLYRTTYIRIEMVKCDSKVEIILGMRNTQGLRDEEKGRRGEGGKGEKEKRRAQGTEHRAQGVLPNLFLYQ